MGQLDGKVVIITGASRGIGEAAARLFAAEGAKVALTARSADALSSLASDIGENAHPLAADIASWGDVERVVDETRSRFGEIDILIGNAGVIEPIAHLTQSDPEGWGAAIDINLKGVYYGMRAVLPAMAERGTGTVITISSGAAHNPLEGWSHYCSSKAGAHMLTQCAHREVGGRGVRIMGLSPGTVATQMQREIKSSGVNPVSQMEWSDHIPPEWPARALLWMCSSDADEFLGQEVRLREDAVRRRIGLID